MFGFLTEFFLFDLFNEDVMSFIALILSIIALVQISRLKRQLKQYPAGENAPLSLPKKESFEPVKDEPKKREWEFQLGGKWLVIIGVVAFIFGVGFFLQYAFQNDWIGETGRVVLGILSGIVFLGLGEYFYRRYPKYSQFLAGGGIGLLYLSFYAAFNFYELISAPLAFGAMIVVTIVASLLAVRYDALFIGVLTLAGGFLTPALISTPEPNYFILFAYLTLLNAGLLAMNYAKNWRVLNIGSFIATWEWFFFWYATFYTARDLLFAQSFSTIFWLLFIASGLAFYYTHKRTLDLFDLAFLIANGLAFFGISYDLFQNSERLSNVIGLVPLLLALVYTFLAFVGFKFRHEEQGLVYYPGGLATLFLTLVFPLQFEGRWITASWLVEGVILMWLGYVLHSRALRAAAFGVMVIAYYRLLAFDANVSQQALSFFNARTAIFTLAIAASYANAFIAKTMKQAGEEEEYYPSVYAIGGNALTLWLGSLELRRYYVGSLQLQFDVLPDAYRYAYQRFNLALSLFYGAYAFILFFVGLFAKLAVARTLAIIIFAGTIFKVFLFDISNLEAGYRIISFLVLGVILIIVGYFYHRFSDRIKAFLKAQN